MLFSLYGSEGACENVSVFVRGGVPFTFHLLGFLLSVCSGNTLHRVIVIFDEIFTLWNMTPIKNMCGKD